MKRLALFAVLAMTALLFTSCGKEDYTSFIGTWGVEKIEYYNIDYAGNPIAGSLETHIFDPNDTENGIQMVFRENKTGEMRDSAIDTVWVENEETGEYDFIYNPDTVMVYSFTYSYDKSERTLYMNMEYENSLRTYKLQIQDLNNNAFVYENEYDVNFIEKAYLKRVSKSGTKSASRQKPTHPHKPGSILGGR